MQHRPKSSRIAPIRVSGLVDDKSVVEDVLVLFGRRLRPGPTGLRMSEEQSVAFRRPGHRREAPNGRLGERVYSKSFRAVGAIRDREGEKRLTRRVDR